MKPIKLPLFSWYLDTLTGSVAIHKSGVSVLYELGYPNHEVKSAWFESLVANFAGREDSEIRPLIDDLVAGLEAGDLDGFVKTLRSVFVRIPYTLHMDTEAYYHSLFYMVLSMLGAKIDLEV